MKKISRLFFLCVIFFSLRAQADSILEKGRLSTFIKRGISTDVLSRLIAEEESQDKPIVRDALKQELALIEDRRLLVMIPLEDIKEIFVVEHSLGLRDSDIERILTGSCLCCYEDLPPVHMRLGWQFVVTMQDKKKYSLMLYPDAPDDRGTVTRPDGVRFWFSRCPPTGLEPFP